MKFHAALSGGLGSVSKKYPEDYRRLVAGVAQAHRPRGSGALRRQACAECSAGRFSTQMGLYEEEGKREETDASCG